MGWISVLWLQLEILFGHEIYSLHFPMCKQELNLSPKYPLRPIFAWHQAQPGPGATASGKLDSLHPSQPMHPTYDGGTRAG